MKKKIACIVLAIIIVMGLAACSAQTPIESTTVSASDATTVQPTESASTETSNTVATFEKMELSLSTPQSETSMLGEGLKMFADQISKATNGQVTVKIYYSGSLFAQDQETDQIIAGNLDLHGTNGVGTLSDYFPVMKGTLDMIDSAYMFNSFEHMQKFFNSDVWAAVVEKTAEKTGIRILGIVYNGARSMNLNIDRKVTSRADLSDIKLRMSNSESALLLGQALGGNTIPVNFSDLYMALQTGTVDAQENGVLTIKTNSFYEVTKSVTLIHHQFGHIYIGIGEKKWQSLSPELQQVLANAWKAVEEAYNEKYLSQEEEAVEFLKEKGLSVYELTDEELASYRQEVLDWYYAQIDRSSWDMDLYNDIQDLG